MPLSPPTRVSGAFQEGNDILFDAVFDQPAVGMILSDPDGTWLRVNRKLGAILDQDEATLSGLGFRDIIHDDDLEILLGHFDRLMADEIPVGEYEARLIKRDGSITTGLITTTAVRHADGIPAHFLTVIEHVWREAILSKEVDGLKKVEESARTQEAWLRAIFEYAPVEIVLKDTEGKIVAISGNVASDLGHKAEDFIGRTTADFLPADVAAIYMAADRKVMETGEPSQREVAENINGVIRHSLNAKFPLRDDRGVITGICSLTSDITDLKRSEEALRKAHDNLERQVVERTRELTEEIRERKQAEASLLLAKEEAERFSRTKSDFLSSMSHELRTPMNAIMGFAQVLGLNPRVPLTESQKDSVNHIMTGSKHLLQLIDQVLDLEKIEAGKMSVSHERVSLKELCLECLSLVGEQSKNQRVTINHDFAACRDVTADHMRLRQVILNLLSNAIKYNHRDGTVSVTGKDMPDNMVRISVSDAGPGIAREKHASVFEPFNRLGRESGAIEGTGIGLTICKQLVEAMGGRIGFESEAGKGATFWIDMPAAGDGATSSINKSQSVSDQAEPRSACTGVVLYIEDNPANLSLMESLVGTIDGLSLISAHNAELGLAIAEERQPDLILMDINLPGMDGITAKEHLDSMDSTRNIPVIAISAAAMKSEIEKGMAAGFRDYLTKPFNVSAVIAAIRKELNL